MYNHELTEAYIAKYDELRKLIYNGELSSLKAICHKINDTYKENEILLFNKMDPVYGSTSMESDLLQIYIIHCAAWKIVPVSGYEKTRTEA